MTKIHEIPVAAESEETVSHAELAEAVEAAQQEARAKRIGLTGVQTAEKRRRIAEIVWLNAQHKAKIAELESVSEAEPNGAVVTADTLRKIANAAFDAAELRFEIAKLRHESAHLKADLAEDKARFPR